MTPLSTSAALGQCSSNVFSGMLIFTCFTGNSSESSCTLTMEHVGLRCGAVTINTRAAQTFINVYNTNIYM